MLEKNLTFYSLFIPVCHISILHSCVHSVMFYSIQRCSGHLAYQDKSWWDVTSVGWWAVEKKNP